MGESIHLVLENPEIDLRRICLSRVGRFVEAISRIISHAFATLVEAIQYSILEPGGPRET